MSWRSWNDSLTNLKGQITTFANNVLADTDETSQDQNGLHVGNEDLKNICLQQQEQINRLRQENDKLINRLENNTSTFGKNGSAESDSNWNWEPPPSNPHKTKDDEATIVANLKKTITDLERDKEELVVSLEQLDSENQSNTERLMTIKNKIQTEYNDLQDEYVKLQDEFMRKSCKKCENNNKNSNNETLEALKNQISILTSNNSTLQDTIEDLEESFKVSESENKILLVELQKYKETIADFEIRCAKDEENCQKLAKILEGYETQVGNLKEELKEKGELENELKQKYDLMEKKQESEENKEKLQKQLKDVIQEKEEMHVKYLNILTDSMKRYMDCDKTDDVINALDTPEIADFRHQVDSILNIFLDLKLKCESLENELFNVSQEKTNLLLEKNHEIEKLIQNSEILSQEVITKTQTIKDYENECSELIKNNDLLINELEMLKNSSGLQTISESNEDNLLLLETQLENANKKIEELESMILKHESDERAEDLEEFRNANAELEAEIQILKEEKQNTSSTLEKMRCDLENTEYQYTEINITVDAMKEEIDNQKKKNKELLNENFNLNNTNIENERNIESIRTQLNETREKLLLEEDLKKQFENQVRNLNEKLQNAKMSETSLKLQNDTSNKELKAMTEAKCTLETTLKSTLAALATCQENLLAVQKENEEIKQTASVQVDTEALQKLQDENRNLALQITKFELELSELTSAKNELATVIINKHQENVTYHNEIQRLTQILNAEAEKGHNLEIQIETLKSSPEMEKLTDRNNFLREKCERLAENLLQEQDRVQKILAESAEKEQISNKKLERLQNHLLEVEEHYTQELLRVEEKNNELKIKMTEIEQREKNSSTMYTSVSIRANQHVETLQNQLQLITNQRDDLRRKISDAEDHARKQEASLSNLQFVLEQFQKDKEKDVEKETERIRRQITSEKRIQEELRKEISDLQAQLLDSKNGLQAASRLSDQLEQAKQLATLLKAEVTQLKEKLSKLEEEVLSLSSQTDGKVDKSLIKNLIIGFLSTNNTFNKDQTQILKIIATVLDFNQQDHDKIGLNKPHQSWLSSILSTQTSQGLSQESLSQAFVKFLENESKPRQIPSLLAEAPKSRKTSVSSARQSPGLLAEVVLPTFADFAQNRNSSSILKDVLKDNSSG